MPAEEKSQRKEIMQEHISRQEDIRYQNQICSEPKVQKILSWQGSDGYFGKGCILHLLKAESGHMRGVYAVCWKWGCQKRTRTYGVPWR